MKLELYHGDYYVYLRYSDGVTLVISPNGDIHNMDCSRGVPDCDHIRIDNLHDFLWELIDNLETEAEVLENETK